MAKTDPEDIVRKLSDAMAAYNRHDLDAYLAMLDPGYVAHDPTAPEPIKGREVVRKVNEGVFKAFPDFELRILNTNQLPRAYVRRAVDSARSWISIEWHTCMVPLFNSPDIDNRTRTHNGGLRRLTTGLPEC